MNQNNVGSSKQILIIGGGTAALSAAKQQSPGLRCRHNDDKRGKPLAVL